MEQEEVMLPRDEIERVRQYLLGVLEDRDEIQRIEERILSDDEFGDLVSVAEGELMEDYLDGSLSEPDRAPFFEYFLVTAERKCDLRLITQLREVQARARATPKQLAPGAFQKFRAFMSMKPVGVGVAVLLVLVLAVGLWRIAVYQTDTDRGLAQLRTAYRGQRIFESRITELPDYGVYLETRGPRPGPADFGALDRAHRHLIDASSDPSDWRAHHALGLFYFAGGDFEAAERELEIGEALEPHNPQLLANSGALSLEMARQSISQGQEGRAFQLLNDSLRSLNAAISRDRSLREPVFNKALCLQLLMDLEQAKVAWHDYLGLDADSPWAEEARRNLRNLEESHPSPRSALETESEFLAALRRGDQNNASNILRVNRELIRETYLPVRLAASIVNADPESRRELLDALELAAELETKMTGDPFATSIANYYSSASRGILESLKHPQDEMASGYRFCREHDYESAARSFKAARTSFNRYGNVWEANIAGYLVGYSLVNARQNALGREELLSVSEFAESRGYSWLESTALYWIGGSYVKSKDHGRAKHAFKRALVITERIDDPYGTQRNSLELSNLDSYGGRGHAGLKHLFKALSISMEAGTSERQRYRTLIDTFVTLSRLKLYDAALPNALEAVAVSDRIGDDFWRSQSRNFAGLAHAQLNDIDAARRWLGEGRAYASSMPGTSAAESLAAFSELKLGDVERAAGNNADAERHYRDALVFLDRADMPASREDALKGLMMTLLALGRLDELESEIANNVEFTERYRATMSEEDDRISFLASRGNVYDVAVDFEFRRGNLGRAYEFAEMSSARALLERLERSATTSQTMTTTPSGDLSGPTGEGSLSDMQRRLPERVQILRFLILQDRVLVWVMDRNRLQASEIRIPARSLQEKLDAFRGLITEVRSIDDPVLLGLGRELYDLLIAPVRNFLDSKNEICIVPTGELFNLPFAALINPEGSPLIAEFDLLYSPSTRAFLNASERARSKSVITNESVLAIGNPAFDGKRFDDLPNLGTAQTEARGVAALYEKGRTLVGTEADKAAFLAALPDAEVIHFAGHYVPVRGAPESSFLLLATGRSDEDDGALTNTELARRRLPRAKLLVLAACRSGPELVFAGEGMIGISRTMLAADIPLVVGSLWAVESSSTAKLMILLHQFRRKDRLATTRSLRLAQLELASDPGGGFSAPYYWAAFSVYGGLADY